MFAGGRMRTWIAAIVVSLIASVGGTYAQESVAEKRGYLLSLLGIEADLRSSYREFWPGLIGALRSLNPDMGQAEEQEINRILLAVTNEYVDHVMRLVHEKWEENFTDQEIETLWAFYNSSPAAVDTIAKFRELENLVRQETRRIEQQVISARLVSMLKMNAITKHLRVR